NDKNNDYDSESPFFVCDLGEIYRLFINWKLKLPRIQPHYAIKCNNDLTVIKFLSILGANFDCASKNEIKIILNNNINPNRIIYANTIKNNSFIQYANNNQVDLMTFDNIDELYKIKKNHRNSKILLRIKTDDEFAQCRLSSKFGCDLDLKTISSLVLKCKELNLNLAGLAFHIGSGTNDVNSFYNSIKNCREIFELAWGYGFSKHNMNILDVGGGFSKDTFDDSCELLNYSLDKYFPDSLGVKFIAEPGRYFVATAFTLVANVIGKRGNHQNSHHEKTMLYINDGVYGNMNCILYDHQNPFAKVATNNGNFVYFDEENLSGSQNNNKSAGKYNVSIWGPTCDGLDCIDKDATLNYPVQVEDWLYFNDLGAYTLSATTGFNGFERNTKVIYVCSE
ncbi:ornithine decarboxylase SPE1 ASCRUDRAFT_22072, partial [Ascoidea rubescens DSM 1968]